MKRLLPVLLALAVPALAHAQADTWNIDPAHTLSSFTVRHLVITNVRGEFGKTTGAVKLDEKDLAKSSVEATIDATTLNTRVPDRDAHLKSPDFFDVAKYPTLTFKSTKVEKIGEGKLKVTGDLTMKGVTKPVVLEVLGPTSAIKDPGGNLRRGLVATTMVNRRDFGLNWSKTVEAGPVVGDEVKIEIEAELVKAAPKQAGK
ncbi:YceI family protein [Anaeromyxobacter dehalogenans]|uniref:YceI n=1 Tax=Anaeromyxobacter dehalogenans (strain 2CP-C) TaxID=290397 RepID=Q2IG85_ANADE|nr:YceI family protein [Anaeromyxobacter dehalogenans]ABC83592.1 YceI [Anaeromyxobacter dehalogenans 2CP-C]